MFQIGSPGGSPSRMRRSGTQSLFPKREGEAPAEPCSKSARREARSPESSLSEQALKVGIRARSTSEESAEGLSGRT